MACYWRRLNGHIADLIKICAVNSELQYLLHFHPHSLKITISQFTTSQIVADHDLEVCVGESEAVFTLDT